MAKKHQKNAIAVSEPSPGFQLLDMRLFSCTARRPTNEKKLPATQQRINVQLAKSKEHPTALVVLLNLALFDPKETESGFLIGVTYGLQFKSLGKPFTEEEAKAIGKNLTIHVVWPYWREFVETTTARMKLPPLIVPLINAAALKFDDEGAETKKSIKPPRKARQAKK